MLRKANSTSKDVGASGYVLLLLFAIGAVSSPVVCAVVSEYNYEGLYNVCTMYIQKCKFAHGLLTLPRFC